MINAITPINPHAAQPTSPVALIKSLWRNRNLIVQMTRREVVGRYKGSVLGLAWSLLTPILMLAVYTFVFSVVFKARWGADGDESKTQFALVLFVGMIVHGLFAEVLNRAPGLIVSNVNYVKKVVFPLDALAVIAMGASLFHACISLTVLLIAFALFNGYLHWTVIFIPFVLFFQFRYHALEFFYIINDIRYIFVNTDYLVVICMAGCNLDSNHILKADDVLFCP
jgi:lipopolysaccharide transport system permease protein